MQYLERKGKIPKLTIDAMLLQLQRSIDGDAHSLRGRKPRRMIYATWPSHDGRSLSLPVGNTFNIRWLKIGNS